MHDNEITSMLQGFIFTAMNIPRDQRRRIRRGLNFDKKNEMSLGLFLDSLAVLELEQDDTQLAL